METCPVLCRSEPGQLCPVRDPPSAVPFGTRPALSRSGPAQCCAVWNPDSSVPFGTRPVLCRLESAQLTVVATPGGLKGRTSVACVSAGPIRGSGACGATEDIPLSVRERGEGFLTVRGRGRGGGCGRGHAYVSRERGEVVGVYVADSESLANESGRPGQSQPTDREIRPTRVDPPYGHARNEETRTQPPPTPPQSVVAPASPRSS